MSVSAQHQQYISTVLERDKFAGDRWVTFFSQPRQLQSSLHTCPDLNRCRPCGASASAEAPSSTYRLDGLPSPTAGPYPQPLDTDETFGHHDASAKGMEARTLERILHPPTSRKATEIGEATCMDTAQLYPSPMEARRA